MKFKCFLTSLFVCLSMLFCPGCSKHPDNASNTSCAETKIDKVNKSQSEDNKTADNISQDDKTSEKYANLLNSLSVNDLKSIPKALETYKEYSKITTCKAANDKLYREFKAFFTMAQGSLKNTIVKPNEIQSIIENNFGGGRILRLKPLDSIKDETLKQKVSALPENGFSVFASEGGGFLSEDPSFLLQNFSGSTTEGIGKYLEIRSKELKTNPLIDDGGLSISWDSLGDRIIEWENYAKSYSDYEEADEAKELAKSYMRLYVLDLKLDNTPMFKNGKLTGKLKASYERFINKYTDSSYHDILSKYYNILVKNDFAKSNEATEFLEKNGYKPMNTQENQNNISVNKINFMAGTKLDTLNIVMTDGKYSEEKDEGPFDGLRYKGKFAIEVKDKNGKLVSSFDLNSAFKNEDMIFKNNFELKFQDYNSDGNIDFAIGQYENSNGSSYKLFTLQHDGKIVCMPFEGFETIYSSQWDYSPLFEKIEPELFKVEFYDNTRGNFDAYFRWKESRFVMDKEVKK